MRRRRKRREDHWSFHINDWLDNGTFDMHEDDMNQEEVPEPKDESPKVSWVQNTSSSNLKETGRFDQFNDEFDGNFNMHSYDAGADHVKSDEGEEPPAPGKPMDEYTDEDPYKIIKSKKGE